MNIQITPELASNLSDLLDMGIGEEVKLRRVECPEDDFVNITLGGRMVKLELNDATDPRHAVAEALRTIVRVLAKDPVLVQRAHR